MDKEIIYIAGLYHSGSTLLDQYIGSNDAIIGLGEICKFIKETYMDDFNYFKIKNKIEINIFEKNSLEMDDYEIEFLSKTNKVIKKVEKISSLKKLEVLKPEVKNFNLKKRKFKKKKFYKKNYKK